MIKNVETFETLLQKWLLDYHKMPFITRKNVRILKWYFVVLLKDWYFVCKGNLCEAASLICFVTCINHSWELINLYDNCFLFNILM